MNENLEKSLLRDIPRLRKASFINGVKFYFDAAIMLAHRSYSSSTFLSVHSQEELAKFHLLDELYRDLAKGVISANEAESRMQKQIFKDHIGKQFYFGLQHGSRFVLERFLNDLTHMQKMRNNALYVSRVKGKLIVPAKKSTKKVALAQLNFTMKALMGMLEFAYFRQHNNSPPDDLGLEENTIMMGLVMSDELQVEIRNKEDYELLDDSLLKFFYYNSVEDNKNELENSYLLCLATEKYRHLEKVRRFVKF